MREIWENFTDRERLLIGILATFLLGVGVFFVAIQPLRHARAAAAEDLARQQALVARVEAGLASVKSGTAKNKEPELSLRSAITSSARERKLALSRIEPVSDNEVTVWLDDVGSAELFNWLNELSTQQSVRVTRASIQKQRDTGSLIVRLDLGRGG